ncbi:MAG: hypothetical protein WAW39_09305 [Prosthecobacter sp.]
MLIVSRTPRVIRRRQPVNFRQPVTYAHHETLESGSSTLAGLRSRID